MSQGSFSLTVKLDPQIRALVLRAAEALGEADMDEAASEVSQRLFGTTGWIEATQHGGKVVVRMSPFAELALLDIERAARRPGSTIAARTAEVRSVLSMAGY